MQFRKKGFLSVPNRLSLWANSFEQSKVPTSLCPFMRSWFYGAVFAIMAAVIIAAAIFVLVFAPIGGVAMLTSGFAMSENFIPVFCLGSVLDIVIVCLLIYFGTGIFVENIRDRYRRKLPSYSSFSNYSIFIFYIKNITKTRKERIELYSLKFREDERIARIEKKYARLTLAQEIDKKNKEECIPKFQNVRNYLHVLHGTLCPNITFK